MTPSELEAALNEAFKQCIVALHPLSDRQKQILLQAVAAAMPLQRDDNQQGSDRSIVSDPNNPLDQLTAAERQAFLTFVNQQEDQNQPWKMTLLNDWLDGRSSGAVQFIRERYGIQWVEQITPEQVAIYLGSDNDRLRLKVGDRIEVTNGLWEWVQETGPCSREWFPCTVIHIQDSPNNDVDPASNGIVVASGSSEASCIIRFENGTEYEIQGIYDWNRPNWRWFDRRR